MKGQLHWSLPAINVSCYLPMLQKNKDLIWCVVGAALFGLFVFGLHRLNQPEQITLDLAGEESPSSEYRFVSDALLDVEGVVEQEDLNLPVAESVEETLEVPERGPSRQIAGDWERVSAPSMNDVPLSEPLERSLAASASLAAKELADPESATNLTRASELRETRTLRQASHN